MGRLFEEELTRSVIGAFYDSYNRLGYGFLESVCVGALSIELRRRKHRVEREVPVPVHYDGEIIGAYKADLVVDGKLLIEVKAEPSSLAFISASSGIISLPLTTKSGSFCHTESNRSTNE